MHLHQRPNSKVRPRMRPGQSESRLPTRMAFRATRPVLVNEQNRVHSEGTLLYPKGSVIRKPFLVRPVLKGVDAGSSRNTRVHCPSGCLAMGEID